jgi:hypothetical protein
MRPGGEWMSPWAGGDAGLVSAGRRAWALEPADESGAGDSCAPGPSGQRAAACEPDDLADYLRRDVRRSRQLRPASLPPSSGAVAQGLTDRVPGVSTATNTPDGRPDS